MNGPQRFRKKPVEIEAWRLPEWDNMTTFVTGYVDECIAIAEWCSGTSHMMVNDGEQAYSGCHQIGPHISIPTLEGVMAARPGDYVIRGVQGEFYPCKPDIFAATYEAVSE